MGSVPVLATLLLIQLPDSVPGKAVEDSSNTIASATSVGNPDDIPGIQDYFYFSVTRCH